MFVFKFVFFSLDFPLFLCFMGGGGVPMESLNLMARFMFFSILTYLEED